jgi:hypothetical protein
MRILLVNATGCKLQKPRSDARRLFLRMSDPNDGLDRLGPDPLDKCLFYHRGARRVKRRRRFFFFF